MKRIYLVSAVMAVFGLVLVSTPVSAAFTCQEGYTGPNTENMCESVEKYQCSVENQNIVTIKNSTNQTVYSGNAGVEGNGSGGGATSGSVTNEEGTTFTVTISNGDESAEAPSTCLVSAFVPAKETPETPTSGRGEAETPVTPSRTVTPQALPVTSGNQTGLVLIFAGSVSLVALAATLYRRLHL